LDSLVSALRGLAACSPELFNLVHQFISGRIRVLQSVLLHTGHDLHGYRASLLLRLHEFRLGILRELSPQLLGKLSATSLLLLLLLQLLLLLLLLLLLRC